MLPALFFGPTELQPAYAKLFCCYRRSHSKPKKPKFGAMEFT